jgi:hypothetical protein
LQATGSLSPPQALKPNANKKAKNLMVFIACVFTIAPFQKTCCRQIRSTLRSTLRSAYLGLSRRRCELSICSYPIVEFCKLPLPSDQLDFTSGRPALNLNLFTQNHAFPKQMHLEHKLQPLKCSSQAMLGRCGAPTRNLACEISSSPISEPVH